MSKLVESLQEAIKLAGLKDGMTISFHHHLRNGDFVLNMVMDVIAEMGIKNLTINASSIHDAHEPLIKHIQSGVVTGIETAYMSKAVGKVISSGQLKKPVTFKTHGGRAADIISGKSKIDVSFIAAPTADDMGNFTGKIGPAACGSLGYAYADAEFSCKTIVITDNLVPYPLTNFSIPEIYVDYVVKVPSIGDPNGIASATTKLTRNPVALRIASYAVRCIEASGYLKDGFAFQTGAGGASLATASYLKDIMLQKKIVGSYIMGGVTGYLVDLLEAGCFNSIMDIQCFDLKAIESIRTNPKHKEVSAAHYAGPKPAVKSCLTDGLDVVVLGATEIDVNFNVNVHTDSNGIIMGGSGGHSDTAAGAKMTVIVAPLTRSRIPVVQKQVLYISTPGTDVDVLVTEKGIAVNPRRQDLKERFEQAGLPIIDINKLCEMAMKIVGPYKVAAKGEKTVAKIISRDGILLDEIKNVL